MPTGFVTVLTQERCTACDDRMVAYKHPTWDEGFCPTCDPIEPSDWVQEHEEAEEELLLLSPEEHARIRAKKGQS